MHVLQKNWWGEVGMEGGGGGGGWSALIRAICRWTVQSSQSLELQGTHIFYARNIPKDEKTCKVLLLTMSTHDTLLLHQGKCSVSTSGHRQLTSLPALQTQTLHSTPLFFTLTATPLLQTPTLHPTPLFFRLTATPFSIPQSSAHSIKVVPPSTNPHSPILLLWRFPSSHHQNWFRWNQNLNLQNCKETNLPRVPVTMTHRQHGQMCHSQSDIMAGTSKGSSSRPEVLFGTSRKPGFTRTTEFSRDIFL